MLEQSDDPVQGPLERGEIRDEGNRRESPVFRGLSTGDRDRQSRLKSGPDRPFEHGFTVDGQECLVDTHPTAPATGQYSNMQGFPVVSHDLQHRDIKIYCVLPTLPRDVPLYVLQAASALLPASSVISG